MNANMYPGASGTNEGLDNNCDGEITGDETEPCAGDWDDDGYITISDLVMMLADYGCTSNCSTDLNGDGHVSSSDITFFLSLFGSTCE